MDLGKALDLAKRGRQQAPVSLRESGDEPWPAERPGRVKRDPPPKRKLATDDRPVETPDMPLDFRLSQAEWYGHVENVAREIAEMAGRPHWYDLREKERVTWRKRACDAIVAVGRADLWLKQRRLAERLDPIVDRDVDDVIEREAVAGIGGPEAAADARADDLRRAQLDRLKELAESDRAA